MPNCFGWTCGDCRLRFLLQAGHGCGLHPAFPAPSPSEGRERCITRAFRAAIFARPILRDAARARLLRMRVEQVVCGWILVVRSRESGVSNHEAHHLMVVAPKVNLTTC
jgi:hypothetical protein